MSRGERRRVFFFEYDGRGAVSNGCSGKRVLLDKMFLAKLTLQQKCREIIKMLNGYCTEESAPIEIALLFRHAASSGKAKNAVPGLRAGARDQTTVENKAA